MKATFIDFEDSFSFNVVQELTDLGLAVEVIHWKDFETLPSSGILALGPGPGHPDDYSVLYPLIQRWLDDERPYFGVCLGHQIYWRVLGELVERSKDPQHGQKQTLELSVTFQEWLKLPSRVKVQRYNSLCVLGQGALRQPQLMNHIQEDEILITRGKNCISYQFHPESVGTSFRRAFFVPVLRDLL